MTASTAGSVAGRLPMTAILQEPSYRRLWASGLLVNVARWVDLVTLGWLALQLTGSPFMVGLAAFARSAPMMVVGPFAGIVADRMPRGRVLTIAQTTGLVAALALAVVFALTARSGAAFAATAVATVSLVATLFTSLYPRVMVSSPDFENSLTVDGAASSHYALSVMSVVALIFVPLVLLYQGWTYYVFRKRVGGPELS